MYSTHTEDEYPVRLERDRQALKRRVASSRLTGQLLLLLALLPITVAIWLGTTFDVRILAVSTILVGLGLLGMLLLCLLSAAQAFALSELWGRECKHSQLRFDVYHAVNDTLGELLQRHLPGFRRNATELNLAEELLREVRIQTERRAEIARCLQSLYQDKDVSLAQAIDAYIAESLKARGYTHDREAVETCLQTLTTRLGDENLITFPHSST